MSVNYYDNYDFISIFASDSLAYRNMTGYDSKYTGLIAELNGNGGSIPIDPQPVSIERVIMTRDYCGNYTYRNGAIERILMGNGFMQDSAYYVQVKDYQGNVRAVLDQNHNVVERNDYYPYGGLINASDTQLQPYKYSSKELDRENGLDLYDSQARWYDPMLPQTTTQDPLAEKYFSISPYTWCAGNPFMLVDPDGKEIINLLDPQNDKQLYMSANNYDNDGAIHIFSHGNMKGLLIYDNGETTFIENASDVISKVLSKSHIWGKAQKTGEAVTIILHACSTGEGNDSFANKLSNDSRFKDDKIIAPTKPITDEPYVREIKGNKIIEGFWKVLRNGKVITSFDATWKPKDPPTWWDRLWH